LLSNIKNLIEGREKLKVYFTPSSNFSDLLRTRNAEDRDFLNKCLDHIYANLQNESFTMNDLAGKMNMSKSTLYRRILQVTMIKPVEFIKNAKLNYAARLILSNNSRTINEIAWLSGFSDPKYFSKCFLKEFGISPSHFTEADLKG
jgi:AraC-like DNA-binding protein